MHFWGKRMHCLWWQPEDEGAKNSGFQIIEAGTTFSLYSQQDKHSSNPHTNVHPQGKTCKVSQGHGCPALWTELLMCLFKTQKCVFIRADSRGLLCKDHCLPTWSGLAPLRVPSHLL